MCYFTLSESPWGAKHLLVYFSVSVSRAYKHYLQCLFECKYVCELRSMLKWTRCLSSPASELQRALSLLGTEQDTSQLRQTLWVMEACIIVSVSLLPKENVKRKKDGCLWSPGNRNSSKATSSRRRLTDWWRPLLASLLVQIRYFLTDTHKRKILVFLACH